MSSDTGNECASSIIGPAAYCGYGLCNITSSTESTCVCEEGFGADFVYSRFPNCYVRSGVVKPLTIASMVIALLATTYSAYAIHHSVSQARMLCMMCFLFNIVDILFWGLFWASDFVLRTGPLVMLWIMFQVATALGATQIFLIMKPLFQAAKADISNFRKLLIGVYIFFGLAELVSVIIASQEDDPTLQDDEKNRTFSNAVSSTAFIVGIACVGLFGGSITSMNSMETTILSIKRATAENKSGNQEDGLQVFLIKLRKTRTQHVIGMFILPPVLCAATLVQFAIKSIPYNYIYFFFSAGGVPLLMMTACRLSMIKSSHPSKASVIVESGPTPAPLATSSN